MVRNVFLARRLSKMKSGDFYSPPYPALSFSVMFMDDFQGGPLPPQCFPGAPQMPLLLAALRDRLGLVSVSYHLPVPPRAWELGKARFGQAPGPNQQLREMALETGPSASH